MSNSTRAKGGFVKKRRRHVKRFTVELDPEEYELLQYLREIYGIPKAKIVRNALREFFSHTIVSIYAPELKEFLDFLRERTRERAREET